MSTGTIVLICVLVALVVGIVVLYFVGKKAQKKQAEQQEMLESNKQTISMLIIDKKRMKIKDSGLPQMVIDQTPKMLRGSKLPIIKAKVGPQIMCLICDEKIFDSVPALSLSIFFLCDHNSKNAIAKAKRINVNDISPIRDHSDDE